MSSTPPAKTQRQTVVHAGRWVLVLPAAFTGLVATAGFMWAIGMPLWYLIAPRVGGMLAVNAVSIRCGAD
ncbi:MAG: hypothetical protein AUJ52_12940 [Elusimicrobia bacterium CG1_02_63_36]|nr:MAG: hypothetical protein AUJ52_12940 [Elusimicrobia bacterium CG1_02_63_36]